MSINKKIVALYLFIAIFIVYIEYSSSKSKTYALPSKTLIYLDKKVFDSYLKPYSTDNNLSRCWGMIEVKKIKKSTKDKKLLQKKPEIKVTQDKNVLCIKKSCYRLIGIHNDKHKYLATMYNKDLHEKIKDYIVKDNLGFGIVISKVKSHYVEFLDLNSTRKWNFKIFDVNQTKYKPEELEE